VVLTPVLLDANRVPIYRDSRALQYPKSSEWGIIDCGIHPDLPISGHISSNFMFNLLVYRTRKEISIDT